MKLYTVGPAEMFPSTLEVGSRQVPYFRNDDFSQVVLECERLFKAFVGAREEDRFVLLTSSGTGAMEASVLNCLDGRDKALVVEGGSFGRRFARLCEIHGIAHDAIELQPEEQLSESHLHPFENGGYTALLVNIDETSTGQLYDIGMLSRFCRRNGMYLFVDAISSFLCDDIDMARDGIDLFITGSQKGLALSPGLSFVLVSERLYGARVKGAPARSMYFDFNDYIENGVRGQTPFTPAVGIVYELQDRLRAVDSQGGAGEAVRRCARLAADFRERIGKVGGIGVPGYRLSNALTPIVFEEASAVSVRARLEEEHGFVLNPCGGDLADKMLRVSHMGNLTMEDNVALADALEEMLR